MRLRLWLANLALVAASLLLSLILIEIALRLLGWTYPVFARPDAELGWSFRPGVRGWSVHENTVHVHINRFGFRGGDWSERPAPGALRVAVLGDSFIDSGNLPEEQSFPAQIEKHLSACPAFSGRRVEVLNFGMSGYSTTQEFVQLQQRVASFHPNMVLVAYYAGNDVPDNVRALSLLKAKPYFVLRPSGELQLDGSFRDSDEFRQELKREWLRRLVNASYLLQAVKQAYLGKPIVPAPITSQVFKATGADALPPLQFPQLFAPPADENWRTAWTITEMLLLRMRDWSESHGVEFRLVIIPEPVEALPGDAMRSAVVEKYRLADLDYPTRRIVEFTASNRIAALSLLEPLRAFGDRNRQFVYGFYADRPGDGHLNSVGTEVTGRAIAGWLCAANAKGS